MTANSRQRLVRIGTGVLATLPWLLAMYLFYWLDSSGVWTSETPHRGKLSVLMLGSGMLLSFAAHSYLMRRNRG